MRARWALLLCLLLAASVPIACGDPGSREFAVPQDSTKDHPAEVDEYLHDEDQARSPDYAETLTTRPPAPAPGPAPNPGGGSGTAPSAPPPPATSSGGR